jgi:hypothetical protein
MSRAYPSAKADATRTGTLRVGEACALRLQSLGSSYPKLTFNNIIPIEQL